MRKDRWKGTKREKVKERDEGDGVGGGGRNHREVFCVYVLRGRKERSVRDCGGACMDLWANATTATHTHACMPPSQHITATRTTVKKTMYEGPINRQTDRHPQDGKRKIQREKKVSHFNQKRACTNQPPAIDRNCQYKEVHKQKSNGSGKKPRLRPSHLVPLLLFPSHPVIEKAKKEEIHILWTKTTRDTHTHTAACSIS